MIDVKVMKKEIEKENENEKLKRKEEEIIEDDKPEE